MLRNFKTLTGSTLAASDGEIGKIQEFYFDDEQWTVRYLVVRAGSWLNGRDVLITPEALGEIDSQSQSIAVRLTTEQVREAPPVETERPVSRQYEERYHQHYGSVPYWSHGAMPDMAALFPTPVVAPDPASVSDQPAEPEGDPHLRSSEAVGSYKIRTPDGELGRVSDFVIDDTDWRIRYLVIATRDWLPGKHVLVAPEWIGAILHPSGEVLVSLASSAIETAPEYDPSVPLSRPYEQRLHEHYERKAYWDEVHQAAAASAKE